MSAGDAPQDKHFWMQALGRHSSQNERDGIQGYDSNTWGAAVGFDTADSLDKMVFGVGLGYARSNVDSDNANNTSTDIDSYQITLYGDTLISKDAFLDGMVAYVWDRNSTTRHDVGGVGGITANADYNADQIAARGTVGEDFFYHDTMLTPTLTMDYMHYSAGSYTESDAGGAGLHVDNNNLDLLNLRVGMKASWLFRDDKGGVTKPSVHAGYKYALLNDKVETTSSFVAGGPAFQTDGVEPSRNAFDAGAGIRYYDSGNWSMTADYDFNWKADYTSHEGLIRAAYRF